MTDTAFGIAIKRRYPYIVEKQRMVGSRLQWCYIGLGLASRDSQPSQGSQGFSSMFKTNREGESEDLGETQTR